MHESFVKQVFDTLNGQYGSTGGVPGVENAFAPGGRCLQLYGDALDAYERLCDRLGQKDDDADVEVIFNAFLDIIEIMATKMYHYGAKFGENMDHA